MPKALVTARTPAPARISPSSGTGSNALRRMCTGGSAGAAVMGPTVPTVSSGVTDSRAGSASGSTEVTLAVGPQRRPPDARTDQGEQRGNDHRANDEGVQENPEADDDAELRQHDQWKHAEHAEHRGKHDARTRDHRAGRRHRAHDPVASAVLG